MTPEIQVPSQEPNQNQKEGDWLLKLISEIHTKLGGDLRFVLRTESDNDESKIYIVIEAVHRLDWNSDVILNHLPRDNFIS